MLTDAQCAMLEPLIEACRRKGKTPPQDLRRTIYPSSWPSYMVRVAGLNLWQHSCVNLKQFC